MSFTTTTKLGLVKPTPGTNEPVDLTVANTDRDKLDDAVGAKICTSSTRPTGTDAWAGRIIRESDTGFMYICAVAGGSVWRQILADNSAGFVANDQLIVVERTGSAAAQRFRRVGDSNQRLEVSSDGVLSWGSGAASADTNLFRDSANVLRTNDSLTVDGNLSVAGVGRVITARKSGDTSRNSTTTLADDPDLQANGLPANSVWLVELSAAWVAGTTEDIKFDWTVPTSASMVHWRAVQNGTGGAWTNHVATHSTVLVLSADGTEKVFLASGTLVVGANSGNLRLRWAQNTSGATNSTMYGGSWLRLTRHS